MTITAISSGGAPPAGRDARGPFGRRYSIVLSLRGNFPVKIATWRNHIIRSRKKPQRTADSFSVTLAGCCGLDVTTLSNVPKGRMGSQCKSLCCAGNAIASFRSITSRNTSQKSNTNGSEPPITVGRASTMFSDAKKIRLSPNLLVPVGDADFNVTTGRTIDPQSPLPLLALCLRDVESLSCTRLKHLLAVS